VSSFLLNLKSQQGLHSASAYEHHAFDGLMQALVTALERREQMRSGIVGVR
jgi:hypothetical protein